MVKGDLAEGVTVDSCSVVSINYPESLSSQMIQSLPRHLAGCFPRQSFTQVNDHDYRRE